MTFFRPLCAFLGLLAQGAIASDSVLVFNEVQYHPADEVAQTEWIELRSLQAVDVDIGKWRIEGGVDYTFPEGTIMPGGGYLVVAANPGAIPGAVGPFIGQLDNGGETIRLVNRNGRVMDELEYDDESDWPVGADGSGATLTRRNATANSGPSEWTSSTNLGGTPGVKNFAEATDPPTVTTLIPLNTTWKYQDNNTAQPGNWNTTAFDDAAWASGASLLYAGSPNISGAGEGLHGYWPLQETTGTIAPNVAAGGIQGSLINGPTWVNDATRGRVLGFDGADDYVDAGFLPRMTTSNNFTWSFWTFSTQVGGNVILGNRYSPTGGDWNPREFIKFTSDAFQYDTNNVLFVNYADIPTTTWLHHAMVKQGTSLTYYRNGVSANNAIIAASQNNQQPFYFGGDKGGERWSGRLDDIAVWSKALPATSIAGLANGTLTPLTAPTGSSGSSLTTALAQGPTTHYFRKPFTFNGAKERTTLALQHMLDDGAVVYLNGAEVLRVNMAGGAVSHSTPASNEITATGLSTSIPIPTTDLLNGNNVLAVEVHQHPANADMVFGASVVATETPLVASTASTLVFSEISSASDAGFFVEFQNQSSSLVSTNGWTIKTSLGGSFALPAQDITAGGFASFTAASLGLTPTDGLRLFLLAPGGTGLRDAREITNRPRGLTADGRWGHPTTPTPGGSNIVVVSDAIVINEIFYHGPGTSLEGWVELHNRSGAPVDVSLWKLTDGVSYQFPANTPPIPAGGYVVIAWNPAAFATLHPGITAVGPYGGSLSGKGEKITLRDQNDNVADQLTYGDSGRWSEWADGGGSSLELRNPNADNTKPEAWDASDESSKSQWVTVTEAQYQGPATTISGADVTDYSEFVCGLLDSGEFLIDDITVRNVTAGTTNLIQNGTFSGNNTATWRIIGSHQGSVVDDPFASGSKVLKVTATGATEHMHNHAETTLRVNGGGYYPINGTNSNQTFAISFRAKWLRGSNRLHTRLWHNRLPRQTLLPMPSTGGTPGAPNSRFAPNIGPTYDALSVSPVVPPAGQPATVSIKVEDANNIGAVQLFTSLNGAAFTNSTMTTQGGGLYTGTVTGQSAGALVQFYVRATDTLGQESFFPPAGPASRAMIPWNDGRAILQMPSGARPHNIRVVLPTADATDMYKRQNLMSDGARPCTVIFNEARAYYHAGVRLKSSEHGRISVSRCGYTLEFGGDDLFLGLHDTVAIDRSGGVVTGQSEILLRRLSNTAGGIYTSEDDLVRVISAVGTGAPGVQFDGAGITGAAILSKTRLDKEYLDSQFPDGGEGSMHKYERIYILTQTINPVSGVVDGAIVPENPKIPQDSTGPPGVGVNSLGASKEAYRWYWLLQNARDKDDFTGVTAVTGALGASNQTLMAQTIDVSAWLRGTIPATLFGVVDNYLGSGGGQHNVLLYFPPGGKCIMIPWDLDFLDQSNPNTSFINGGDLGKFLTNASWKRDFYGHMLDILSRSFNTTYMNTWATHYSRFGTDNMTGMVSSYLTPRASAAMNAINVAVPPVTFARTSLSPATVSTPFATVSGNGWVNVNQIRLQGSSAPLAVTWTGQSTWSLQLPVSAGTNTYTLVAFNAQGVQVGSTTVTITGSGGVFAASPGSLVVSEIHFNPPGTTDLAEFIELWNITGATLNLAGCHFDEELGQGISYTFPAGVQLLPGGRIIVARDQGVFNAQYGGGMNLAPGVFTGALDNAGESIVLYAASGLEIFRFSYPDNIAGTDGDGKTLVRVLSSTNPSPNGYTWRASTATGGNPNGTDAIVFTGSPLADVDIDGFPAMVEYLFGTSDTNGLSRPPPPTITFGVDGSSTAVYAILPNADDVSAVVKTTLTLGSPWQPTSGASPAAAARFFQLKATVR